MDAIWWGAETAEEMERFIEKEQKTSPSRRYEVERMKKLCLIFGKSNGCEEV